MESILNDLINLFENNIGAQVNAYYVGDPIIIPRVDMPALIVNPTSTDSQLHDTHRDRHEVTVSITVVIPILSNIDADTPQKEESVLSLVSLVEGEDDEGNLRSDTVLGIIARQVNINEKITQAKRSGAVSVAYNLRGVNEPGRANGLITQEATVTLTMNRLIPVRY